MGGGRRARWRTQGRRSQSGDNPYEAGISAEEWCALQRQCRRERILPYDERTQRRPVADSRDTRRRSDVPQRVAEWNPRRRLWAIHPEHQLQKASQWFWMEPDAKFRAIGYDAWGFAQSPRNNPLPLGEGRVRV